MAVEDTNTIDFISTANEDSVVRLTIVDTMEWGSDVEQRHVVLLQEKLNSYLRFIESGEILEKYPAAKGKEVVIDIRFMLQPNERALKLLRSARAIIEEAGFALWLNGPNGPW